MHAADDAASNGYQSRLFCMLSTAPKILPPLPCPCPAVPVIIARTSSVVYHPPLPAPLRAMSLSCFRPHETSYLFEGRVVSGRVLDFGRPGSQAAARPCIGGGKLSNPPGRAWAPPHMKPRHDTASQLRAHPCLCLPCVLTAALNHSMLTYVLSERDRLR